MTVIDGFGVRNHAQEASADAHTPAHRVALVTGAGRGIGMAVARRLAVAGVETVLGIRGRARGAAAVETFAAEGLAASAVDLDVDCDAAVTRSVAEVLERHGRVDILVNNAAVLLEHRAARVSLGEGPAPATVLDTLDTNVVGAYRLMAAVLPGMLVRNYGRIVNVSSDMARSPELEGRLALRGGFAIAYRMSKAALDTMTRVVADEVSGTNVKINSASPGCVRTAMGRPDADRSPEQGADTIAWLATLPDDGPSGCFVKDRRVVPW